MKRRVLLAKALVRRPDILLLDEPTNHLDIEAIGWLEEFLLRYSATILFVTHDRALLRRLATRIIELDRGRLTSWSCDYETYVQRKEAALEAEARQRAEFDKKLAKEEVWIRTGIQARRTRNEGRVRALEKLRERPPRPPRAAGRGPHGDSGGRTVRPAGDRGEARQLRLRRAADHPRSLHDDHARRPGRADRPQRLGQDDAACGCCSASCRRRPGRSATARISKWPTSTSSTPNWTTRNRSATTSATAPTRSRSTAGGGTSSAIWRIFSSRPSRPPAPVARLSGGERNRLLLARLFTKPSNVLVMDEPTNDLDIETLELLEDLLVEYPGTLLLVSHDREFLNNVVTSTLVLEGEGRVKEYAGGYDDWLRQRQRRAAARGRARPGKDRAGTATPPKERPRRLTYKEQRELEALPERIAALEAELGELHRVDGRSGVLSPGSGRDRQGQHPPAIAGEGLAEAYQRWEELETLREQDD